MVRPSIKLYMIRHAESMNNEVYRTARHLYGGGTPDFDQSGWVNYINTHRTADPPISSSNGVLQANLLANNFLVEHLRNQASRPVRFVVSPMRRTIETILPTLRMLEDNDSGNGSGDGEVEGGKQNVDIVMNALYFESEGCHLRGKTMPGMNQFEIKTMLSSEGENSDVKSTSTSTSDSASKTRSSGLSNPSFVGFDQDPNLGWYNYGDGPEHRFQAEERASAFYTWLCEYLDEQLLEPYLYSNEDENENENDNNENEHSKDRQQQEQQEQHDIYDAGVSLPEESHEICHDKMSTKRRKRRTVVLVGHGDFMSLCLKRMTASYGYSVENHNVPHRTAFIHYNTGITELEYFGKGE